MYVGTTYLCVKCELKKLIVPTWAYNEYYLSDLTAL